MFTMTLIESVSIYVESFSRTLSTLSYHFRNFEAQERCYKTGGYRLNNHPKEE